MLSIAHLPERSIVAVEGGDAEKFLQGIITGDMDALGMQGAIHSALLSPQGKIMFEFMVVRAGEGFRLETSRSRAAELVRRLGLYKLRAAVQIADRSAEEAVYAAWGDGGGAGEHAYADPRLPTLGWRFAQPHGAMQPDAEPADAYHAHRIDLGVPEAELDYALGETFPHEACLDVLGGVSFDKGCFIGQEVVSRMQHRGTARRRFVMVQGSTKLPPARTEITAGDVAIGAMGSSVGARGLALVRLDRAAEAMEAGTSLRAGDVEVELSVPPWAPYALGCEART